MKRFEGGSTAALTFSDEVAAGTITDMLSKALSSVKNGEQPKYGDATALMEIVGTEGSGMTAADREVRKYSKLDVRVLPTVAADDLKAGLTSLQSTLNSTPLFDEVNTFASAVASEMKSRALVAIVVSMLVITLYIWFRFENLNFGLAILVALVHDVLFVLGSLAFVSYINGTPIGDLFMVNDFRINMSMIAAFLTLVGFSLNDTIVIFDRVREVRGKNPRITAEMVNTSLNQTLSRTILTSLTVWLVVIVLYVMGGEGIHGFAFCLTVGVLVGTYSTIYIASPVMLWLSNRNQPQPLGEASLPKANGVMRPANG
jgi:SecD/SecF fusion protein